MTSPLQLGVLLIGQRNPYAAPAPAADAQVVVGNVVRVAAQHKGTQLRLRREMEIARRFADGGFAIGLHEMADPVSVMLEVQNCTWHRERITK